MKVTKAQETIVTAAEGGINYWADRISYVKADSSLTIRNAVSVDAFVANIRGVTFRTWETEDGRDYTVTAAEVTKATNRILTEREPALTNAQIRRYIAEDAIDADAADCIIQVAAFGRIIYG